MTGGTGGLRVDGTPLSASSSSKSPDPVR